MKKRNIILIIGIIILAIVVGFLSFRLYKVSQKTEKVIVILKDEYSANSEKYLDEIKKMKYIENASIIDKKSVEDYCDKKLREEFANEINENSNVNYGELIFDYVEDEMKAVVLDVNSNKVDKLINQIKSKEYVSLAQKTKNEYGSFLRHTDKKIQIFFKNDAKQEEMDEVYKKIEKLSGIKETERKTKEDALNDMKELIGDSADNVLSYFEGENNIFPESIILKVSDDNFKKILEEVEKLKNENECIEKYNSPEDTINSLINMIEE